MILNINYFLGLIKLREVYFENLSYNDQFGSGVDIVRFVQCSVTKEHTPGNFLSTSISLQLESSEIFANFKKGLRYDIRKEMEYVSRGDFILHDPDKISISDLDSLIKKLNRFLVSRNLSRVNKKKLKELTLQKKLVISFIQKYGGIINYHVYLFDKSLKKVRLLYSFDTKSDSVPVNKVHTWFDIKAFQEMGMSEYDFGGISSFDQPNGIDQFKLSFGGTRDNYHTSYQAFSKLGRFVLVAKGL